MKLCLPILYLCIKISKFFKTIGKLVEIHNRYFHHSICHHSSAIPRNVHFHYRYLVDFWPNLYKPVMYYYVAKSKFLPRISKSKIVTYVKISVSLCVMHMLPLLYQRHLSTNRKQLMTFASQFCEERHLFQHYEFLPNQH